MYCDPGHPGQKEVQGELFLISGRCSPVSDGVLSTRCCIWCILRIRCCVRLRQVHCLVGWLHPASQFAFQRQVRQTHRIHRTQSNIFTNTGKIWEDGMERAEVIRLEAGSMFLEKQVFLLTRYS